MDWLGFFFVGIVVFAGVVGACLGLWVTQSLNAPLREDKYPYDLIEVAAKREKFRRREALR